MNFYQKFAAVLSVLWLVVIFLNWLSYRRNLMSLADFKRSLRKIAYLIVFCIATLIALALFAT